MAHGNDSTNMTYRASLSPLENGFGQAAWAAAVVVALLLIVGCIAAWLFEHSKDQALADRTFIPLQAIFICFTAMLLVMAFQRCFWIGLTKKIILDEAVEMGWLFGQLGLPQSDWRVYILKNNLAVFIAERPLAEPSIRQIKAACFYFFKIMFGYSRLSFWTAVAQKRACFLHEQVKSIIAEIEAAQPSVTDDDKHTSEEDRQALLDLQNSEQTLLRQVAEQAEKIIQSTSRTDDLSAQALDLARQLEVITSDKKILEDRLSEVMSQLSELEHKNAEIEEYINRSVGGLNAEIKQKEALVAELQDFVGKGTTDKAKRAKLHREAMLFGAICLPMIFRKIEEAKQKIENGCPGVKYSLRKLDRWFQEEWPKHLQYQAALLEAIASKSDPNPDIESKKMPVLTREFLFELLREAGFAAGKGEKEEGVEDDLWLADDIDDDD
ncbi:MAG: hypothetical protein LBP22_03360 [Deltaproteobacteria bacterium]|jgi:hypothetical protein|nr:hypothetical protein [Deltaproteobacteria bacterium]